MITIHNIKNIGKLTAIVSFAIGTFLVLFFALFKTHDSIVIIGFYYIGIATVINLIVFISIFICALYFWNQRHELFVTCGILLLNIPIAIAYFFLVIYLGGL